MSNENINYDSLLHSEYKLTPEMEKRVKSKLEMIEKNVENLDLKSGNEKNTIIAITGNRGSGKTNFMLQIRKTKAKEAKDNVKIFNTIDPTKFSKNANILELILSQVKTDVKDSEGLDSRVKSKINNTITEIVRTIMQSDGAQDEHEKLELIENTYKLKERINKLLKKVYGNRKLYLFIDDIDLVPESLSYELFETIRRTLNGIICIVLAYKEKQLSQVFENEALKEVKQLHEAKLVINSDIRESVYLHLEKLVPVNHKIPMYTHYGFLGIKMKYFKESIPDDNIKSELGNYDDEVEVYEFIKRLIYNKTRLKLDAFMKSDYNDIRLPKNVRGIMQLIATLMDLEDVKISGRKPEAIEQYKKLIFNIDVYREMFLHSINTSLDREDIEFIDGFYEQTNILKNDYIYEYINKKIDQKINQNGNNSRSVYSWGTVAMRHDNLGLYDVIHILQRYSKEDINNGKLTYTIKLLYSIELLKSYINQYLMKSNGNQYDNLIKRYAFKYDKLTIKSENKIDYKKLYISEYYGFYDATRSAIRKILTNQEFTQNHRTYYDNQYDENNSSEIVGSLYNLLISKEYLEIAAENEYNVLYNVFEFEKITFNSLNSVNTIEDFALGNFHPKGEKHDLNENIWDIKGTHAEKRILHLFIKNNEEISNLKSEDILNEYVKSLKKRVNIYYTNKSNLKLELERFIDKEGIEGLSNEITEIFEKYTKINSKAIEGIKEIFKTKENIELSMEKISNNSKTKLGIK